MIGTIDIESERRYAFSRDVRVLLERGGCDCPAAALNGTIGPTGTVLEVRATLCMV